MRLSVILFTIVLGGLITGTVFFVLRRPVEKGVANEYSKNAGKGSEQAFLLPISETNYLPIRDFTVSEPEIGAKAAALFDVKSGRFIFVKNSKQKLPIASVTKLMSAIIILENMDLNNVFSVPAETVNVDGTGADLYKGERIRGTDLFKMMLIKSSNDAALTFADQAQKQGIDFVAKMNEKARIFGMLDTHFSDPAGLDDHDSFSTAADLVKLVSQATNFGAIMETLKIRSADVTSTDGGISHHLVNTNQLLGHIPDIIIGKTGYTDLALGSMVLEVGLNGGKDQVISVVLGSNDRFGETRKLMEWASRAYSWR